MRKSYKTAIADINRVDGAGSASYDKVFDSASNIQMGSRYMEIRLNVFGGDMQKMLDHYGTGAGYGASILSASALLAAKPADPINALNSIINRCGKSKKC